MPLTNKQIGRNVAALRELTGISMEELADAMKERGHKWTKVTVFNIEHGDRRLQLQEAADLIDSVGLPLEDGMWRLMAEDLETRMVKSTAKSITKALTETLPDVILKIRKDRVRLETFISAGNQANKIADDDPAKRAMSSFKIACEETNAADKLEAASLDKVLKLVRSLFDVSDYELFDKNIKVIPQNDGHSLSELTVIVGDTKKIHDTDLGGGVKQPSETEE